jgi:hypothetical protein
MKIRTDEILLERLDEESSWRKRELAALSNTLSRLHLKDTASNRIFPEARSAILLSYAHLEGFIKTSSRLYVERVFHKKRPLSQLAANIRALACRDLFIDAGAATKQITVHLKLIDSLTSKSASSGAISPARVIDTYSKLDKSTFENICLSIGLNYDRDWAELGHLLQDLYTVRCEIAHGERIHPKIKEATDAASLAIRTIDKYKDAVMNLAVTKGFMKARPLVSSRIP